ncbi:MAG: GerW family sporulation protein [Lachnospiraceae bacterium]|nr:GerW family sporulation protein [Lachnospiraceae bacterium]
MAENQFPSTVDALFKGMDNFITTKTVVGEPVKIDANTTIIPLVDVSCGMAAGSFAQSTKTNGGGGLSAKMSPSAILVIQNGMTKLVNIKHQDAMTKIIDMVPDFMNRFMGKDVSADAVAKAEEMAEDMNAAETVIVTEEVK